MDQNRDIHIPIPQFPSPPSPSSSSTSANFPILALSILGILTTSILLLSYYIFVIRCCLTWRRPDILSRLSGSRHRHHAWTRAYSRSVERNGLNESAIRAIPTFRYSRGGGGGGAKQRSFHECAVCLNEFQEEERIRQLPNCLHVFHIDCIDTWLQSNANCPLCRSGITAGCRTRADHFLDTAHQQDSPNQDDDIVIEIRDESSHENQPITSSSSNSPPAKNSEQGIEHKKRRELHHMSSMGDECINTRAKDEQFSIQPIRRSFSMDSSSDRQLYIAVQKILQQNPHFQEDGFGESSSSSSNTSGRVRRSFFSFSHHRSSRKAVLPIRIEL
ncbi:RING-H2 finger protein ATL1-like [Typha angustifolia]|uniref:RING-H2 finger protein ATL1-like n=1 Tax=Typha angustifolia TaxID=59011 RepID=UPI003C30161F